MTSFLYGKYVISASLLQTYLLEVMTFVQDELDHQLIG